MRHQRSFISDFISRMLPSMIMSQLVLTVCSIIDTALAGQFLGDQAVAAEGLAGPVVVLAAGISSIMAAGNTAICSNESGKGNLEELNSVFSTAVTVSVGISLLFTAVVLLFSGHMCSLLNLKQGTVLYEDTCAYMRGYVLAMPALSVIMVFPGILQIEGDNQTIMIAAISSFALDIVFDLVNLFVIHGGVLGMALATTLSYWISAAFILFRLHSRPHAVKFSLKSVRLSRVREIMSFGTPALVQSLSIAAAATAINAAFLKYGSESYVTAFTVVTQVGEILLCFSNGICEMTATVTGIVNGEEDRKGLVEVLVSMLKRSLVISAVLMVAVWLAGDLPTRIFTKNPSTMALAMHGLRIFSLQLLFRNFCECYIGYLRGIKRHGLGNVVLAGMALFTAAFAFASPIFGGAEAIWYSYAVAMILTVVLILALIGFLTGKSPFRPGVWILKPDDFGIPENRIIEFQSLSMDELISFSEQGAAFVGEHGGSSRQKLLVSLFIEEMGKNIITYAYEKKKNPLLSIKLMRCGEGFRLRFRDNGVHFNPLEYYQLHSGKEDALSNFGIRMVLGSAPDATFLNTMNCNNLIVNI